MLIDFIYQFILKVNYLVMIGQKFYKQNQKTTFDYNFKVLSKLTPILHKFYSPQCKKLSKQTTEFNRRLLSHVKQSNLQRLSKKLRMFLTLKSVHSYQSFKSCIKLAIKLVDRVSAVKRQTKFLNQSLNNFLKLTPPIFFSSQRFGRSLSSAVSLTL